MNKFSTHKRGRGGWQLHQPLHRPGMRIRDAAGHLSGVKAQVEHNKVE